MQSLARQTYLSCCEATEKALANPDVETNWNQDSCLEHMTVGALAAHLARSVTLVPQYFVDPPTAPEQPSSTSQDTQDRTESPVLNAAEYYKAVYNLIPAEELNAGVLARAISEAELGPGDLRSKVAAAIEWMHTVLPRIDPDAPQAVVAGILVSADEYLNTRTVEIVTHLDDLAVSTPSVQLAPQNAYRLASQVAVDLAIARHGPREVLANLARAERVTTATFPVF